MEHDKGILSRFPGYVLGNPTYNIKGSVLEVFAINAIAWKYKCSVNHVRTQPTTYTK